MAKCKNFHKLPLNINADELAAPGFTCTVCYDFNERVCKSSTVGNAFFQHQED